MPVFTNHIIQRIQKGNLEAEKELYDTTCAGLMATAKRYVQSSTAAKDILQESYIIIFTKLDNLTLISDRHSWAWMRKIVSAEAIRWLKKQNGYSQRQMKYLELNNRSHEFQDHSNYFKALLMSLNENQRNVFNLFVIEGYTHKEISKMLDISCENSRILLSRARKNLQSQINYKVVNERK